MHHRHSASADSAPFDRSRTISPRALRWIAAAGIALVALLTLLADLQMLPDWIAVVHAFPGGDKIGHLMIYGLLMAALDAAYQRGVRHAHRLPRHAWLLMIFVTVEEAFQAWLPMRTASGWDLAFSHAGILLALAWRRRCAR